MSTSQYFIGSYAIDLTSHMGRVAWVLQYELKIVAKGTAKADRVVFDVLKAISLHAESNK